jgi:spore germination cell wall hydrolase CwlJ-like protein
MIEAAFCLALNVYFEARSQGIGEMIAVSEVVMNRVESPRYPDTVCEVVKQGQYWEGHPIRNQCQFSWHCDGLSDIPINERAWALSQEVAHGVLVGRSSTSLGKAIHYHADYVYPSWAKTRPLVGKVGVHYFYR